VITQLNGKQVTTDEDLQAALNDAKEEENVSLTILRHGKVQNITVKPEKRAFDFPKLQELRELRDLPERPEFRESMQELRREMEKPEFRESMQELRREMQKLKEEMKQLKKELRESD
jgi:predicted nuclease with TOPRIM domain